MLVTYRFDLIVETSLHRRSKWDGRGRKHDSRECDVQKVCHVIAIAKLPFEANAL